MVPLQKLEQIHQRYEFLEAQMSAGISGEEIAKLSKEYSQLKPVVETIEEYKSLLSDLQEAEVMMADPDMRHSRHLQATHALRWHNPHRRHSGSS